MSRDFSSPTAASTGVPSSSAGVSGLPSSSSSSAVRPIGNIPNSVAPSSSLSGYIAGSSSAFPSSSSASNLDNYLNRATLPASADRLGGLSTSASRPYDLDRDRPSAAAAASSLYGYDRVPPATSSYLLQQRAGVPLSNGYDRLPSSSAIPPSSSSLLDRAPYDRLPSSAYDRPSYSASSALYDRAVAAPSGLVPSSLSYDPYDPIAALAYPRSYDPLAAPAGYLPSVDPRILGQYRGPAASAAPLSLHPAGYDRAPVVPVPAVRPAVLVVGATGNVGEATVKALAQHYGNFVEVRAGVRDVNKARAKFGSISGVQVVHADMAQPATLTAAMQGVDRVFCVVPGPTQERTQHAIACANAAVQSGVRFLLMLSVLTADIPSTIFGRQFNPIEAHVKQLNISSAIIRLPMFFDNYLGHKGSINSQGVMYGSCNPGSRGTFVSVQDIGECAAAILVDPARHNGRVYKLVSQAASNEEVAQAISAVAGKPVKYQQVPPAQVKQALTGMGMPDWQVDGVLELNQMIDCCSPITNERDTSDVERILGRPATTIWQWIQQNQAAFVDAPATPQAANVASPQRPAGPPRPAVLVVGATGNVGEATVKALVQRYGNFVEVRAGVRDVNKARAKFGSISGVQVVHADMAQPATLTAAMQGVDRVFCVVPGPTQERTQHAIACANAAVQSGVRFLLMLSVLTADIPSTIFGRQFNPIEAHVKQLNISSAIIRLPMFFDNYLGHKGSINSQGVMYGSCNPGSRGTFVSVQDIGECAAAILVDPARHNGRVYKLVSQAASNEEVAQAISASLGKPVKYQQVPPAQVKQALTGMGMPDWQVDGVLELNQMIDSGSPITNERDTSDVERILGRPATTIWQWAQQNRAAF